MPNSNRPVEGTQSGEPTGTPPDRQEWTRDIRAHYDAVTQEPLPDEIQQLMDELAKSIRP